VRTGSDNSCKIQLMIALSTERKENFEHHGTQQDRSFATRTTIVDSSVLAPSSWEKLRKWASLRSKRVDLVEIRMFDV
jgi:hypothetical protein